MLDLGSYDPFQQTYRMKCNGEQREIKSKDSFPQKLPPSQPADHLCVLFSAKNDAGGCQRLPVGFPWVSPLLHPSFTTAAERKVERKKENFQMSAQNPCLVSPKSPVSSNRCLRFHFLPNFSIWHSLCTTATAG